MHIINSPDEMHHRSEELRLQQKRIGIVPTMGSLHEGHLSLIDHIRSTCDIIILTIFVNPIQFGPGEDFKRYPRDNDRDIQLAEDSGVHILFMPDVQAMYPKNFDTYISVDSLTGVMCGARRPGHFKGVATIVAKLFHITQPHTAVFGQKDYQQSLVIRRMTQDLNFNINILVAPIIRENDGLALSSRNVYLSSAERKEAAVLYKSLTLAKTMIEEGATNRFSLISAIEELIAGNKCIKIDYIHIGDAETLESLEELNGPSVIAIAAHAGKARLIDNVLISPKKS